MKFPQKLKIPLLFIVLIIFLFVLNLNNFQETLKNFFYLISAPFQKELWEIGEKINFTANIFNNKSLKEENGNLYLKNQELLFRIGQLEGLESENNSLRAALNLGLEKDFEMLLAKTVSKEGFQDSILIDKGEKDGIIPGLPVITAEKVLIGRIGKIYYNFSEVVLITNKELSFDAKLAKGSEKEIYLVRGEGNFRIFLDRIPRQNQVQLEDLVLTTRLGGFFPEGLIVGEIAEIKKSDTEVFQQARIKPSFRTEDLDNLFIIKNFHPLQ